MEGPKKCLFCEIVAGREESTRVFENDSFLAIKNKFPVAPIHLLVMPKAHVSKQVLVSMGKDGFWEAIMETVFAVIKKQGLDKTGYKLVNNGAGYNHFDHEHIHVLGGSKEEPGGKT